MKARRGLVGALWMLTVMVAACTGPGSAVPEGINLGNRARDFTLASLDGAKVSLSDREGDVVLVNFWASWCAPCMAEIPTFEAAYRTHKEKGFVVLGVNEQESREMVEPFVDALGLSYPILLDEQGQLMKEYRVIGLPMSLLLDRDGVIRVRHTGILTSAQLENHLTELLQDP